MSPPLPMTQLFRLLPYICKLTATVLILSLFFLPSLFFYVFVFIPLITCALNFSTLFLPTSTTALTVPRVPSTNLLRTIFWRSCGSILEYLSGHDARKVDDGGDPPPLECIELNKSELPSFDASSNSSVEEEVQQEEPIDREERKLKEDEIIHDEMTWDLCDLDVLLDSEDYTTTSFRKLLLFWRKKERGLV